MRFDGDGFSKEPIEGDEAARHRHMFKDVSDGWVSIGSAVAVVKAIAIVSSVIKVGGPVMVLALGVGAYAKSQGWL